ncbi:unnamed protein product [Moneuplotes crassus]|uniref:Uncharacterized protein n=1 Tax=Euplotes crassus TaxID=5936 RepID=A0AAD1Y6T9_EUPCR|nr:unnamed protein product [Moneuplotes crassus]|eukprot:CAMPEP_0197000654 /NCGR_PEP_ID=MMETSP1380-20130617/5544_1 /TAXON_ID=5936 /ORGANISM="Euplotes crassus, Strain CT5" /LENGTH=90 /DNA_ID=CAMNT_0042418025 /DNA_START=15 /DNA_END=287 /DNA_ORIENTATION=-
MLRPVKTEKDVQEYMKERHLVQKWRDAITHCKTKLDIEHTVDFVLEDDQRMSIERCLTEDYLLKHGLDYFGKRDYLVIDMIGSKDIAHLQ